MESSQSSSSSSPHKSPSKSVSFSEESVVYVSQITLFFVATTFSSNDLSWTGIRIVFIVLARARQKGEVSYEESASLLFDSCRHHLLRGPCTQRTQRQQETPASDHPGFGVPVLGNGLPRGGRFEVGFEAGPRTTRFPIRILAAGHPAGTHSFGHLGKWRFEPLP